ncbi:hypothetical protein [Erythrobacter sp. R86502]|uniref:hypothetical protein n=1 Tax=Erythrobacter sp. R86502 TaxID=3093846 RepID=UPI0036D30A46
MSEFRWTDATGATVVIDRPDRIEAEAKELALAIDRLFREADVLTGSARAQKRNELRIAFARLDQLSLDVERWNEHVKIETRDRARIRAREIRAANEGAAHVRLVVGLHDEFEYATARSPDRLRGEPSQLQTRAASLAQVPEARHLGPTFVTAFEQLQLDPQFYRPASDEGGWFEWRDAEGVLCRLISPLAIEREIDGVIGRLFGMISNLEANLPHLETVEILGVADDLWSRLNILQVNLKAFDLQNAERDEEEWKRVQKEWDSRKS